MKFYIQIPNDGRWGEPTHSADFDVMTIQEINNLGWYEYITVNAPHVDSNYKTWYELEFADNQVKMVWHKELKTGDALIASTKNKWHEIRNKRNSLLSFSDYTQLADAPITDAERQEWVVYRQALRNITTQPDPFAIVFPTSPKGENLNIEVYRAE